MMTAGYRWILGLGLAASLQVNAATQLDIDTARNRGLAYLVQSQKGPGFWSSIGGLETQTTAAVLEAMQNAGIAKGASLGAGVSWLANADPDSIDGLARKIKALQGAGRNVTAPLNRLLSLKNSGNRYIWGAYAGFETGFPDTPLALSAVKAASGNVYPDTTQLLNSVYCEFLPSQQSNGSWSYVKPGTVGPGSVNSGAIIPTAYMLIELASIKAATGWDSNSCGTPSSLSGALTNGANWLLTKKNADGGFGENGQSARLDTALAYLALQAARPTDTALPAAQDYMLIGAGKPLANGSWSNDPLSTALVLKTLPATVLADTVGNGIPDSVKTALGIDTTAGAARALLPGNGQAQAGVTQATLLASAMLGQPFSYSLASGFTGPFGLAAGSLPDGLALNAAAGTITGTPTRIGTFNFTLANAAGTTELQIAVSSSSAQVPLLSPWALGLLSAFLLTIGYRSRRRHAVN